MSKKIVHIVSSSSGGSGNTTLAINFTNALENTYIINTDLLSTRIDDNTYLKRISIPHQANEEQFTIEMLDTIITTLDIEKNIQNIIIDATTPITLLLIDILLKQEVIVALRDLGIEVMFHIIVPSSGLAAHLTLAKKILKYKTHVKEDSIVMWINEYLMPLTYEESMRETLFNNVSKTLKTELGDRLNSIVRIEPASNQTRSVIHDYIVAPSNSMDTAKTLGEKNPSVLIRHTIKQYFKFYNTKYLEAIEKYAGRMIEQKHSSQNISEDNKEKEVPVTTYIEDDA